MLVAFGVIAVMAHREGHEERFGRLYGDATAAARRSDRALRRPPGLHRVLGAHEAGEVSAMLEHAVPGGDPRDRAPRRRGRPADRRRRLRHVRRATTTPQCAARAALALQEATAARWRPEHPDWPRFRAGLNTGEASVGVLGSGSGRTYSAIGDTVNLASRIEGPGARGRGRDQRRDGGQLLGSADGAARDGQVKGRAEPVEVLLLAVAARARLAAGLADPDAEHLGRADRGAALLALDRERRRERRRASGQRCRVSPPQCGHAAGSSASPSRK